MLAKCVNVSASITFTLRYQERKISAYTCTTSIRGVRSNTKWEKKTFPKKIGLADGILIVMCAMRVRRACVFGEDVGAEGEGWSNAGESFFRSISFTLIFEHVFVRCLSDWDSMFAAVVVYFVLTMCKRATHSIWLSPQLRQRTQSQQFRTLFFLLHSA